MAIRFRFDVLEALKQRGYTSYKIRANKIMSESTLQKLRNGDMVAISNIDTICGLLDMQPGDLLKYDPLGDIGKQDSSRG